MADSEGVRRARAWLIAHGLDPLEGSTDLWVYVTEDGEASVLGDNDLATHWFGHVLEDTSLPLLDRFRTALGMIELTKEDGLLIDLEFAAEQAQDRQVNALLWEAYRRWLDMSEPPAALLIKLSMRLENITTAEIAFRELLGATITELQAQGRLCELASQPLLGRAQRLLPMTGWLPWDYKYPLFQAALAVPQLHDAVFEGLRASQQDLFGDVPPQTGLALLARLDLSGDLEPLTDMRHALQKRHNRQSSSQ